MIIPSTASITPSTAIAAHLDDACSVSSTVSVNNHQKTPPIHSQQEQPPKRVRFHKQVHFRRYKTNRNQVFQSMLFYTKNEIKAMKEAHQNIKNNHTKTNMQLIRASNALWKLHQECCASNNNNNNNNNTTSSSSSLSVLQSMLNLSSSSLQEEDAANSDSCWIGLERILSRPIRQDKVQRRRALLQILQQNTLEEERIRQECERITLPSRLFAQQVAQLLSWQQANKNKEINDDKDSSSTSSHEEACSNEEHAPQQYEEVVSFSRNIINTPTKSTTTTAPMPLATTCSSCASEEHLAMMSWSRGPVVTPVIAVVVAPLASEQP